MIVDLDLLWLILGAALAIATLDDCTDERANVRQLYCTTEETN